MNWTDNIAGCFGQTDLVFAGHANDEARAFDLLSYLRQNGVGWAKTQAEFEAYLINRGASAMHRQNQLDKLEAHYRPWLVD